MYIVVVEDDQTQREFIEKTIKSELPNSNIKLIVSNLSLEKTLKI